MRVRPWVCLCLWALGCGGSDAGKDDRSADAGRDSAVDARADRDADLNDAASGDAGTKDAATDAAGDAPDAGDDASVALDPIDVSELGEAVLRETCRWLEECSGRDCADWPAYPDLEAQVEAMIAGVGAERMALDGVEAAHCKRAFETLSCAVGPLHIFERPTLLAYSDTASCAHALRGAVPAGESCRAERGPFFVDECEPASACAYTDQPCSGTCVARVAEGEACGHRAIQCQDGLYCNYEGICEAQAELGDTCASVSACPEGSLCLVAELEPERRACVRVGTFEGDPCDGVAACRSPMLCHEGTCRTTVPHGSPCTLQSQCGDGDVCRYPPDGSAWGTCQAPFAEGDTCVTTENCASPLRCFALGEQVERICQAPGQQGEACTGSSCDSGLYCHDVDFVCRPLASEGESCDRAQRDCAEGNFCMGDMKCHPVGAENEPCDPYLRSTCERGLFCAPLTNTCQLPRAQGEVCAAGDALGSCQPGLYCDCSDQPGPGWCVEGWSFEGDPNYTCAPQRDLAADCDEARQCLSGYCDRATLKCADVPPGVGGCSGP